MNISTAQVYVLIRRGELRGIKIGGRGTWPIGRDDLEAYIERTYDLRGNRAVGRKAPVHRWRQRRAGAGELKVVVYRIGLAIGTRPLVARCEPRKHLRLGRGRRQQSGRPCARVEKVVQPDAKSNGHQACTEQRGDEGPEGLHHVDD
jgi:excisionase family DNA binding protein